MTDHKNPPAPQDEAGRHHHYDPQCAACRAKFNLDPLDYPAPPPPDDAEEAANRYWAGVPWCRETNHDQPCNCAGPEVLAEALRDFRERGVGRELAFLISCPWCGEAMNKRPISAQMTHVIACGDKREVAAQAEAARLVCLHCGNGDSHELHRCVSGPIWDLIAEKEKHG